MEPQINEIDENLYSRQLYAIGFDAMKKMTTSSVLISGMNGLGVEIAKNAILQGFKMVTLHDTNNVTEYDLSTNYYITHKDIGKNMAEASYNKLVELNSYVKVDLCTDVLTFDIIKNYSVVVLVDYDIPKQIEINNFTHVDTTSLQVVVVVVVSYTTTTTTTTTTSPVVASSSESQYKN